MIRKMDSPDHKIKNFEFKCFFETLSFKNEQSLIFLCLGKARSECFNHSFSVF